MKSDQKYDKNGNKPILDNEKNFWHKVLSEATQVLAFSAVDESSQTVKSGPGANQNDADHKARVFASIDPQLMKQGQEFIERNFVAVTLGQVVGFLYLLAIKSLTAILLRNDRYIVDDSVTDERNLRLLFQFSRWYRSNFTNPATATAAVAHLTVLRRIHRIIFKRVGHLKTPLGELGLVFDQETNLPTTKKEEASKLTLAVKNDLAQVNLTEIPDWANGIGQLLTYEPLLPMSQADVSVIHCFGYSFIRLYPKFLGIPPEEVERGMKGFLHLWEVVGRAVGLEDCHNVAYHERSTMGVGNESYCQGFLDHVVLPSLQAIDPIAVFIQQYHLASLSRWLPIPLSYNVMMCLCLETFFEGREHTFKGENLRKLRTWPEKLFLSIVRIGLFLILHVKAVRLILNFVTQRFIDFVCEKHLGLGKSGKGLVEKGQA